MTTLPIGNSAEVLMTVTWTIHIELKYPRHLSDIQHMEMGALRHFVLSQNQGVVSQIDEFGTWTRPKSRGARM